MDNFNIHVTILIVSQGKNLSSQLHGILEKSPLLPTSGKSKEIKKKKNKG